MSMSTVSAKYTIYQCVIHTKKFFFCISTKTTKCKTILDYFLCYSVSIKHSVELLSCEEHCSATDIKFVAH